MAASLIPMNARLPHPFATVVGRLLTPPPEPASASGIRRIPPMERLAADFGEFVGSQRNAEALIRGLRTGTPIALVSAGPSSCAPFTSPTGPLSYANVRVVLALARGHLAAQGIVTATPEQLHFALIGDTASAGILARRAAGFGWGRIAHALGMKLGPVLGAKKGGGHGKS